MLPKLDKLQKNNMEDSFLFAGIDLMGKNKKQEDVFIPIKNEFSPKHNSYFLMFWNEQVLDDLLEDKEVIKWITKNEIDMIMDPDSGGLSLICLTGYKKSNIKEFLELTHKKLNNIIY